MLYNKIKELSHHPIIKNSSVLLLVQVMNMVAPLIVLPYLTRVLGVESFGVVMMAFSAIMIAKVLTDFGFNLSATYDISKNRSDIDFIAELIGAIFVIKFFITIFIFSLGASYIYYSGDIYDLTIFYPIFINVFFQAFVPGWFFQGIEKMKIIAFTTFLSKMLYVFFVVIFVKNSNDASLVIYFSSISSILTVVLSVSYMYMIGYKITFPKKVRIVSTFKYSSQFFLSRLSVSIYTSVNTFLVGAVGGVEQSAIYGACEKLYQASQSITTAVVQALFPYLAVNKKSNILLNVQLVLSMPLLIILSIVCFFSSDILTLIFGSEYSVSENVLRVFMVMTFINFLSSTLGYPAFAKIGRVELVNYTVFIGAALQILLVCILYMAGGVNAFNVVCAVLVTEVAVLVLRVVFYNKFRLVS